MIRTLISMLLAALTTAAFAQDVQTVVDEGKRLYRSEITSWNGTDIFIASYKNTPDIGGYFSYPSEDKMKCVFFSRDHIPVVVGTVTFDSSLSPNTAQLDTTRRLFTAMEATYHRIRSAAFKVYTTDKMFVTYPDTNPNFIPIITGGVKKVYVITGPQKQGVVIFGNDYLLEFDENDNCVSKKQLHANIITNNYSDQPDAIGAIHSHVPSTGDLITPTDICTLMLYEKYAKWQQYQVISDRYISTWNCLTDKLTVTPTKPGKD